MNADKKIIITHPDKVLFPEAGFTKQHLADYYEAVSGSLLPFLKNRPIMLHRFPQGIGHHGFYQKDIGNAFPDWISRVLVAREKQDPIEQAVINTKAALRFVINQNTVVLHPWLSTVKDLHKPDKIIFDLDPAEGGFKTAVKGALLLRGLLEKEYGLTCFVMTTGSSGLHVTIPIKPNHDFDAVRPFALMVAEQLSALHPAEFTTEQRIEDRKGRLFVDYLRNSYAQTAVAPYAVRALPGAPVAAPLFWEELADKNLKAQQFNIVSMPERLKNGGNPWQDFRKNAISLTKALAKQKSEMQQKKA
ncbi:non-homologous end-joining DNA ligase [Adhaeribacter sp. BT258]|uniref:Non-homologous end-joining DNA ligase n=1 Tax=Adhaeribacter terrigena TaxID=2793070 RepID=A0ABS1C2Q5_9BACT|nr:non-homologous end-joining DNA ligase [Adhaeribacter terrigena]MBK0403677.1 non-homologous end-joining DNA ligase [Adhaeribacter terrigena]